MNQRPSKPEKKNLERVRGSGLRQPFTNYCKTCGVKCECLMEEISCNNVRGCNNPHKCNWNKILNEIK